MFVSFSRSVRRPCGIHAAKKSEVFETIKKNGNFLSKNDKFLSKVDKYAVLIRFFSFRLPLPVMLSGAERSRNISLMSFRRFRCVLSACREILRLRCAPLRMTAGAGRKGNVPCPERARPVCGMGAAAVLKSGEVCAGHEAIRLLRDFFKVFVRPIRGKALSLCARIMQK